MSGLRVNVAILVIMIAMVTADTYITYYEHPHHKGEKNSWLLRSNGGCVNFALFDQRISSVNTHKGCVILFEEHGCQGNSLKLYPGTDCHDNLQHCDFDNKPSSVSYLWLSNVPYKEGDWLATVAPDPSVHHTNIDVYRSIVNSRFRYRRHRKVFKTLPISSNSDRISWARGAISEILKHMQTHLSLHTRVGFTMHSQKNQISRINVSFRRRDQLHPDVILEHIARAQNSNEAFLTYGNVVAQYDFFDIPVGGARTSKKGKEFIDFVVDKRNIIHINNGADKICLSRAIVTAISRNEYSKKLITKSEWENLKRGCGIQQKYAKRLCRKVKIDLREGANGRDNNILYDGTKEVPKKPRLNIMYGQNLLTSLPMLNDFFPPFSRKLGFDTHNCPSKFPCCKFSSVNCHENSGKITSKLCLRYFYGDRCYNNHIEQIYKVKYSEVEVSLCDQLKKCQNCIRTITT
ncbi:hypothetical protein B566_EDAN014937 [Ephemera danica]|nr:hypothetical protein B566_EDAN014937 [Ephemera danica]